MSIGRKIIFVNVDASHRIRTGGSENCGRSLWMALLLFTYTVNPKARHSAHR